MNAPRRASWPAVLAGTVLIVLAAAAPAFGHVEITPARAPAGTFATFTFSVPNEQATQVTTGLDVTVPAGFVMESAQAVAGWTTKVDLGPDGTAAAVHWSGGRLPPHTFGTFAITGKVAEQPATLRFVAVQHYGSSSVTWNGSESSEHPVPTLVVTAAGTAKNAAAPETQVPRAQTLPSTTTARVDDLARSRADVAVMLALAALVAMLGVGTLLLLERRRAGAKE